MTAPRRPRPAQRGGVFWTLVFLLLLALLAGTLYLFRAPLLTAFAEWWVVDEPPARADALVVLGGDSLAGERVRHAVTLYQQGWAPKIVLSGGPLRADFSEADLMEKEALRQGVPAASLIVFRHQSTHTLGEALALRSLFAQHNFRQVILVTSNFHTRRARRIFRAVCEKDTIELRVSAAPDLRFHPDRWWRERDGRIWLPLEILKSVHTWYELWRLPAPAPTPPATICLSAGTAL